MPGFQPYARNVRNARNERFHARFTQAAQGEKTRLARRTLRTLRKAGNCALDYVLDLTYMYMHAYRITFYLSYVLLSS